MGYIYVFEFPNGKRYVGATTLEPEERTCKNGCKYVGKFRKAIDIYGWDNIERNWFTVPDELLDDIERSVIQWLRTTDPEYGYNIQSGGKTGFTSHHTEESRMKISESKIGHLVSEYTRKKLSDSNKGHKPWITGKHHTYESKKKMSESHKGKKKQPLSEEHRRKISEAKKK